MSNMKMTTHRENQLNQLLRRLRQMAFDSDKAALLIPVVKARLMPGWRSRHDSVQSEQMLRLWA